MNPVNIKHDCRHYNTIKEKYLLTPWFQIVESWFLIANPVVEVEEDWSGGREDVRHPFFVPYYLM